MPTRAKPKIIIDTNLWISFLLNRDYSKIDLILAENNALLLFSQELIEEFIEVIQRPKFKRYFSLDDIEELMNKIRTKAKFITITSRIDHCRDPKDNFLLALAQDGKATHLITGDKDLLDLKSIGKTKILTMSEFLTKK